LFKDIYDPREEPVAKVAGFFVSEFSRKGQDRKET